MPADHQDMSRDVIDKHATSTAARVIARLYEGAEFRKETLGFLRDLLRASSVEERLELFKRVSTPESANNEYDQLVIDLIDAIRANKMVDPDTAEELLDELQDLPETVAAAALENRQPDNSPRETTKAHEQGFGETRELSKHESNEIAEKSLVHNGEDSQVLDMHEILKAGLGPKHEVVGLSRKVVLSDCFYIDNDRLGCMAFVEDDSGPSQQQSFVARSYYMSQSGGAVWRYMPEIEPGGRMGKGYGDKLVSGVMSAAGKKNSVVAPAELQVAFAQLLNEGRVMNSPAQAPAGRNLFVKTARVYDDNEKGEVTYFLSKHDIPLKLEGNFYPTNYHDKIAPEKLDYGSRDSGSKPDFSKVLHSYKTQYKNPFKPQRKPGEVEVDFILSTDEKFRYMFIFDPTEQHAWVGGVEPNTNEIGSTGQAEYWVDSGDLTTPPAEYPEHLSEEAIDLYSNDVGHRHYREMYQKYISKIPIIKEYLDFKVGKQRGVHQQTEQVIESPPVKQDHDRGESQLSVETVSAEWLSRQLEKEADKNESTSELCKRIEAYAETLKVPIFGRTVEFNVFMGFLRLKKYDAALAHLRPLYHLAGLGRKGVSEPGAVLYENVSLLQKAVRKLQLRGEEYS